MDKLLQKSLLFDFYGELLTEHQRQIYEEVVMQDCSLGEIASAEGITRQGVHDIVKRCEKIMAGYEDKLHLVEKYVSIQKKVAELEELIKQTGSPHEQEIIEALQGIPDIL